VFAEVYEAEFGFDVEEFVVPMPGCGGSSADVDPQLGAQRVTEAWNFGSAI